VAKKTNMMVPASWTGQDKRFAESIKETVDCLVGQRGDPLDKAVTVKDLLGSGLAVLPAGGAYSGVPNDLTPPPPDTSVPNIGTPPAPTNLTASGSFQNILLAWNLEIYAGHSAVEVYRHTSDSITNSTLIGRASGRVGIFSDSVGGGLTFYYWVRAVNQNGEFGPYNSSSGTAGTTQPDIDILLNELTDQITDTQLATDLSTSITLITAPSNVTGSVANRILAESIDRALAVSGEASARSAGFIAEATARTSAIAVETAARNSAIQAEETARISAIATESTNRANALATEASTRASDIAAETSARVSAVSGETSARATAIAAEATARASAISASATALQNQINDLLDIAEYDANTSYVTDDQVTYQNKLYKASQATTGNLPTNTTYWTLLGNYSSLGDLVGSNTSSITAINTVSASSTSAAAQAINSLNSTVNDANTGVSATSSALDAVETLVNNSSTGVTASANKISALESTVNDSSTGVAATAGQMDAVETLVNNTSTGVAASATKISALETTVNDSSTGVAATSGALDTVETLVNHSDTGVAASATKISALETTVNNATTGVAATSGALDTVETLVNHSDTGVAASATKISALETTVNDSSTGVSATSNALDTVETLVNHSDTGVAASATKISALETTVNNATTGVAATSGALDTVETLVNHSDTGVAASATKISALETTVNDPNTGVSATSGALDTVETLVNHSDTGVAASATKIGLLETTVNDASTGVAATSSALDTVETLVNHSDTGVAASATKISALETTVNDATTGVAATSGALDTVETLVNHSDTGVAASATKISALETTVNDPNTGVSATSGALDTVETLVNHADTGVAASATKISALETTVNDAATGVSATSGALDTVETLVNHSDTGVAASATKISALETTVNDAATGVAATSGALDTVETLVNHSDTGVAASATKISALETTVNDATTGVSATSGALDTVETLVNNSDTGVSATATKVSNLETTVNGADGNNGLAANFAVLNSAVTDTETGLSATASSVSGLLATVGDSTSGLVQSVGAISTSSSASATDISNLIASLNTLNDETDTSLNAAVLSERAVRVSAEGANASLVSGISSSLNNKTQTFAQDDIPVSIAVGDLWIDTNDNNKLYRATSIGANEVASNEWVTVRDTTATTTTFSQNDAPTSVTIGDLWIDTNDQNKVYRSESVGANEVASGEWVLLDLGQALASASAITALNTEVGIDGSGSASRLDNIEAEFSDPSNGSTTLAQNFSSVLTQVFPNGTGSASSISGISASINAKPNTFAQSSIPTSGAIGDLWIDTGNNNQLYRASAAGVSAKGSSGWVLVSDNSPSTTTFSQDEIPVSTSIGDLWIDTNDKNKLYRAESVGADQLTTGEWILLDLGEALASANAITTLNTEVFPDGTASASRIDVIASELSDPANGTSTLAAQLTDVFTEVLPNGSGSASAISGLTSSIALKPDTSFSGTAPTASAIGDLWINSANNNKLYRAESIGANEITTNEWVLVSDNSPTTSTFSQDGTVSIPTSLTIGDLWINTGDDNKLYRAESVGADQVATGEWVLLDVGQALQSASALSTLNTEVFPDGVTNASRLDNIDAEFSDPSSGTTTLAQNFTSVLSEVYPNGTASASSISGVSASLALKPNTFAQNNAPTATAVGDIWVDTDDNNKLYRAESVGANEVTTGEWVAINDTTPTTKTFTGSSVPTAISIGDLWVNTENDSAGNPKNHLYRAESVGADEIAAGEWVFFDLGQAVSTAGVVSLIDANVFPNGSSSASSTDQISARLNDANGNSSGVTLEQQFVANANSLTDLGGQYSVKIDANGHVAGFGLSNTVVNGTPTSAFIIRADKFAIIDPSSTADGLGTTTPNSDNIPFVYTSGESASASNGNVAVPAGVYMNAAYIKNGSITTAQIGTATIGTAQITGTLSANQIDSNTIAANSIDASKLNIDGSSITSVDVNGVPTLQLGDVNVNKLTGTSISASIMSGTSVFANKLSGDVNTLVPFRTFVTQQYGGSETTMVETELPASSHPDGHKPFAIATGYIQPRFERVYRFKMYMKTTTSTSNSLGNPTNAVFTYTNGIIYRYIDFTGDITGSVSNGWTLTSGSKTGTVTNVSVVSGNTRIYYSGSVAFATTDSITASSGTGYQLVGESRMKAATATKMSFAVSGSKADADAGTITMKVTVTQHNSSDTSLDSFTSTVFINEVSGMIMGVR
jgi:uncharacterized protein (UPF0147 family)